MNSVIGRYNFNGKGLSKNFNSQHRLKGDAAWVKHKQNFFRHGHLSQRALTTQAQPRRTSDVIRESGTANTSRHWLQRIVRCHIK